MSPRRCGDRAQVHGVTNEYVGIGDTASSHADVRRGRPLGSRASIPHRSIQNARFGGGQGSKRAVPDVSWTHRMAVRSSCDDGSTFSGHRAAARGRLGRLRRRRCRDRCRRSTCRVRCDDGVPATTVPAAATTEDAASRRRSSSPSACVTTASRTSPTRRSAPTATSSSVLPPTSDDEELQVADEACEHIAAAFRDRLRRSRGCIVTSPRDGSGSCREATASARTARSSASGRVRRTRTRCSSTSKTAASASPPRRARRTATSTTPPSARARSALVASSTSPTSATRSPTTPSCTCRTAPVTSTSATPPPSTRRVSPFTTRDTSMARPPSTSSPLPLPAHPRSSWWARAPARSPRRCTPGSCRIGFPTPGSRCSPTDRARTPTSLASTRSSPPGVSAPSSRRGSRAPGSTAEQWSLPGLFIQSGRHDPEIVFARHDYAYDEQQQRWYPIAGIPATDLLSLIDANETQIEAAGVNLYSYIAPGDEHTTLSDGTFYTEDGQRPTTRGLGHPAGRG